MSVDSTSADAAYLTKPNIIHPESEKGTAAGETRVAAAEARARADIGARHGGVAATGGAIKRGR